MQTINPIELRTMGEVEASIASASESLAQHAFLKRLETGGAAAELRSILPRFSVFVFTFQDVLRIAHARCTHPEIKPIVGSLEDGDRGHERWYMDDLRSLGIDVPLELAFSRELSVGRDAAYTLVASILDAEEDFSRLTLILCLEAIARQFFLRVPGFAKRAGIEQELRYFGGEHLLAEEDHEVFEDQAQRALVKMEVPEAARLPVRKTIERTFACMQSFADDLVRAMNTASAPARNG
jgi:hypothetical protein